MQMQTGRPIPPAPREKPLTRAELESFTQPQIVRAIGAADAGSYRRMCDSWLYTKDQLIEMYLKQNPEVVA